VSIRPGWFHHPAEDDRVRTVENLESLYFSSVGGNGKLLLNVPPTRDGLLHSTDVARLAGLRAQLNSVFERDLARDARRTSSVTAPGAFDVELNLGRPVTVAVVRLEEDITRGQSVARYTLYGAVDRDWLAISHGSTIGYTKLDRFEPVTVRRMRLAIEESRGMPEEVTIKLYSPSSRTNN
jgi:alpha-L-fucosidase